MLNDEEKRKLMNVLEDMYESPCDVSVHEDGRVFCVKNRFDTNRQATFVGHIDELLKRDKETV